MAHTKGFAQNALPPDAKRHAVRAEFVKTNASNIIIGERSKKRNKKKKTKKTNTLCNLNNKKSTLMSFLLLSSLALVAWSEPVPLFRRATIGANFNFVTVESGQLGSLAVRLATTRAPALAPVLRSNESALPTAWFFDATLGAMDVYNESYRRWWRAHANATAFREQRVLVRNATAVLAAALAVETRVCLLECVTRLRAEFGVDAAVELTDLAELTVLLQRGFAWPTAPDAIALRNVRAITHLVNDAFVYSLNSAPAGLVMPGFHAKIAALLRAQTVLAFGAAQHQ
jgi:hypothetical protein